MDMINIFSINKDILSVTSGAVMHGCNIECTFGAGLALAIKKKWPEAYNADLKTRKGDFDKLGGISYAKISEDFYVVNLYQQSLKETFYNGRALNYNAFYDAFDRAVDFCQSKGIVNIFVPYKIGCGLAGGDWEIVYRMMKSVMQRPENKEISLFICEYSK